MLWCSSQLQLKFLYVWTVLFLFTCIRLKHSWIYIQSSPLNIIQTLFIRNFGNSEQILESPAEFFYFLYKFISVIVSLLDTKNRLKQTDFAISVCYSYHLLIWTRVCLNCRLIFNMLDCLVSVLLSLMKLTITFNRSNFVLQVTQQIS